MRRRRRRGPKRCECKGRAGLFIRGIDRWLSRRRPRQTELRTAAGAVLAAFAAKSTSNKRCVARLSLRLPVARALDLLLRDGHPQTVRRRDTRLCAGADGNSRGAPDGTRRRLWRQRLAPDAGGIICIPPSTAICRATQNFGMTRRLVGEADLLTRPDFPHRVCPAAGVARGRRLLSISCSAVRQPPSSALPCITILSPHRCVHCRGGADAQAGDQRL